MGAHPSLHVAGGSFFSLRRPLCAGGALVAQAAGPRILMVHYRVFRSRGCKVVAAQKRHFWVTFQIRQVLCTFQKIKHDSLFEFR